MAKPDDITIELLVETQDLLYEELKLKKFLQKIKKELCLKGAPPLTTPAESTPPGVRPSTIASRCDAPLTA